jgi:hypothetical protein
MDTLLRTLAADLSWQVDLTTVDEPGIGWSLYCSRFREASGWQSPSWGSMLRDLASEYQDYEALSANS